MKRVVGKLEAAERQLNVAVDLYFRDGEPIAIHTLAAAAHGIVHDVNLARMRAIGEPAAPGFENLSVKDIPGALRERGTMRDAFRLAGKLFSKQEFYDCFMRMPPTFPPLVPAKGLDALAAKRSTSQGEGGCGGAKRAEKPAGAR